MKRPLHAIAAAIIAMLVGLIAEPAVAVPSSGQSGAYTYDGHHTAAHFVEAACERGPPTAYDHHAIADYRSRGASARPELAEASVPGTHTIPATLALASEATTTTRKQVARSDVELLSLRPGRVAANSGKALEKWAWPPNRGFLHDPVPTTLKPGTIIDRYGRKGGTFVSPKGTPFRQRSLPPDAANAPYRQYEVVGEVEVRGGIAAPWFGQPGGGVQYELPGSVADLISRGIFKPVG